MNHCYFNSSTVNYTFTPSIPRIKRYTAVHTNRVNTFHNNKQQITKLKKIYADMSIIETKMGKKIFLIMQAIITTTLSFCVLKTRYGKRMAKIAHWTEKSMMTPKKGLCAYCHINIVFAPNQNTIQAHSIPNKTLLFTQLMYFSAAANSSNNNTNPPYNNYNWFRLADCLFIWRIIYFNLLFLGYENFSSALASS